MRMFLLVWYLVVTTMLDIRILLPSLPYPSTLCKHPLRVEKMSYPNYHGDCRKLNFPNLDLWYETCQKAHVDCHHIYIYRDPYAILKSTTIHRNHNSDGTKLATIHLYTSLQAIILAQLMQYADKTLGCMGMLNEDQHHYYYNNNNNNDSHSSDDWWEVMRMIFGWKNVTSFHHHVQTKVLQTAQEEHDIYRKS